jgi:hypothetical protein
MPITLKYISLIQRNKLDHQLNPLNSSVSLNHKQGANLKASVNFQPMGQVNRQGAKHPSVKSFPLSEGRKQSREGRRSKGMKHQ